MMAPEWIALWAASIALASIVAFRRGRTARMKEHEDARIASEVRASQILVLLTAARDQIVRDDDEIERLAKANARYRKAN